MALVVGAWALGGTLAHAVLGLYLGLSAVLLLWAARAVISRQLPWKADVPFWRFAV